MPNILTFNSIYYALEHTHFRGVPNVIKTFNNEMSYSYLEILRLLSNFDLRWTVSWCSTFLFHS
jgi:hypothetical protein